MMCRRNVSPGLISPVAVRVVGAVAKLKLSTGTSKLATDVSLSATRPATTPPTHRRLPERFSQSSQFQRWKLGLRAMSGGGEGTGSSEEIKMGSKKLAAGRDAALKEATAEFGAQVGGVLVQRIEQGVDLIKHAEQIGKQMAGPKALPPMEAIAHERQMTLLMALYFQDAPELVPGLFSSHSPADAIREIRNSRLRCLAYAVMDDGGKWGELFRNALRRAGLSPLLLALAA